MGQSLVSDTWRFKSRFIGVTEQKKVRFSGSRSLTTLSKFVSSQEPLSFHLYSVLLSMCFKSMPLLLEWWYLGVGYVASREINTTGFLLPSFLGTVISAVHVPISCAVLTRTMQERPWHMALEGAVWVAQLGRRWISSPRSTIVLFNTNMLLVIRIVPWF